MNFDRPIALFGILLAAPILLFGLRKALRLAAVLPRFADAAFAPRAARSVRRRASLSAACGALFAVAASVGLAGPSLGFEYVETAAGGAEIALLVDVSNSMLAEDQVPSRLGAATELARYAIRAAPEARYSLTVAKGGATTLSPMTDDVAALEDALEFATPESVTAASTDLGAGVAEAAKTFGAHDAFRVLVILSDGDDRGGSLQGRAAAARKDGILVVSVVFGTERGAPVNDASGKPILDKDGTPAVAKAVPSALARASSSGIALKPETAAAELRAIVDRASGKRGGALQAPRKPRDVSGFFFAAAAFLAAARFFLSPTGALS